MQCGACMRLYKPVCGNWHIHALACTVVMWWPSTKSSVRTMLGEDPRSMRHSFST